MISSEQPDSVINQLGPGFKECAEEQARLLVTARFFFNYLKKVLFSQEASNDSTHSREENQVEKFLESCSLSWGGGRRVDHRLAIWGKRRCESHRSSF